MLSDGGDVVVGVARTPPTQALALKTDAPRHLDSDREETAVVSDDDGCVDPGGQDDGELAARRAPQLEGGVGRRWLRAVCEGIGEGEGVVCRVGLAFRAGVRVDCDVDLKGGGGGGVVIAGSVVQIGNCW